jgi:uncharacterized protein (DUF1778 family)
MDSSQLTTRSSRLSLRIAPEALDEIREAASAQQQDVTSFVLGAAMERARVIRLETRVLALAPAELARFMAAIVKESGDSSSLAELLRDSRGWRALATGRARGPRNPSGYPGTWR